MEFKGRIYKVFPVQSGTSARGNEWAKQEFIFEFFEHETDRYSDKVLLSAMNDRIDDYDLHEGDEVVIGFGHSVRDWNGKYFNELHLYKLEKVSAQQKTTENGTTATQQPPQSTQGAAVAQQPTEANANAQKGEKEKDDELPF